MTLVDQLLEQELADTFADARRRRGVPEREASASPSLVSKRLPGSPPASRSETVAELARDLIGHPAPPKIGVCSYCGAPSPRRTVCAAHSDLPQLDPSTGVQVTTATTRSSR